MSNWKVRYKDFPKPLIQIGGVFIYSKLQVFKWMRNRWPEVW